MDVITAWDRCAAYIRPKLRSIIIEPGKEAGEYEKMSDRTLHTERAQEHRMQPISCHFAHAFNIDLAAFF